MSEHKYHTKTESVDWYIRVDPDFFLVRDDEDKVRYMKDIMEQIKRHVDGIDKRGVNYIVETETRCSFCGELFDADRWGECARADNPDGLEEGLPLCCEEHQQAWLAKREETTDEQE